MTVLGSENHKHNATEDKTKKTTTFRTTPPLPPSMSDVLFVKVVLPPAIVTLPRMTDTAPVGRTIQKVEIYDDGQWSNKDTRTCDVHVVFRGRLCHGAIGVEHI